MPTDDEVERAAKAIYFTPPYEPYDGGSQAYQDAEWDSMGRGGNDLARDLYRRQARAALATLTPAHV
jgi:hypothetical protein